MPFAPLGSATDFAVLHAGRLADAGSVEARMTSVATATVARVNFIGRTPVFENVMVPL
jgi:hypothetical protein